MVQIEKRVSVVGRHHSSSQKTLTRSIDDNAFKLRSDRLKFSEYLARRALYRNSSRDGAFSLAHRRNGRREASSRARSGDRAVSARRSRCAARPLPASLDVVANSVAKRLSLVLQDRSVSDRHNPAVVKNPLCVEHGEIHLLRILENGLRRIVRRRLRMWTVACLAIPRCIQERTRSRERSAFPSRLPLALDNVAENRKRRPCVGVSHDDPERISLRLRKAFLGHAIKPQVALVGPIGSGHRDGALIQLANHLLISRVRNPRGSGRQQRHSSPATSRGDPLGLSAILVSAAPPGRRSEPQTARTQPLPRW